MSEESSRKKPSAHNEEHVLSKNLELPATVWGSVLDFLPYGNVRSCLLISKMIANEASKHVSTLNIMRPREMDIPASRRFVNVENLNILCLVSQAARARHWLNLEAAQCAPLFLLEFRKLKNAFVGGYYRVINDSRYRRPYMKDYCTSPYNHEEIFRGMINTMFGLYKTRSMPANLKDIQGLADFQAPSCVHRQSQEVPEEVPPRNQCQWCTDVCTYLPVDASFEKVLKPGSLCLSERQRYHAFLNRPGLSSYLTSISSKGISKLLIAFQCNETVVIDRNSRLARSMKNLRQSDRDLPFFSDPSEMYPTSYLEKEALDFIDQLCRLGLRLDRMDPEDVTRVLTYHFGVWAKSAIDKIISLGLSINNDDIFIVDDAAEHGFRTINREVTGFWGD